MSQTYIPKVLRERVSTLARHRCGYCLTAETIVGTPIHPKIEQRFQIPDFSSRGIIIRKAAVLEQVPEGDHAKRLSEFRK